MAARAETALEDAWARASNGDDITLEQRAGLRFASANAVHVAASVVRDCAELVGADGVYRRHPIERVFRDAHVLTHHVSVASHTMAGVSKVLHGVAADDGLT